jgi:SAM-dependent methyltransferase
VARQRLPDAQIINSTLGEASFPIGSFDIITMVDTVYYLPYPLRDLARLRDLLRPGGLILIEFPNFRNRGKVYRWMGHRFCETWMYFYTPETLEKMLYKAGLRVIAGFGLPGHQVGGQRLGAKLLTWSEFYLTEALAKISGGRKNLVPHFILVATATS